MQNRETEIKKHAVFASRLLDEADHEFGRSNFGQTSEKLWEAAKNAVTAVCVCRGWQHKEYDHLRDAIERLAEETKNDSLYTGFRIAYDGQLFVGSMDEDDVDTDRPIVRAPSTTTTRLRWWLHPAFTAGGAASLVGAARPLVA